MTTLKRNETAFYYCLYNGKTELKDEDDNATGEYVLSYSAPVKMKANISSATGYTNLEQFGNSIDYDKVIVTCQMDCPINENTVLFIDKDYEADSDGNPLYDYIVKKVSKSLNSISIAVKRVNVS